MLYRLAVLPFVLSLWLPLIGCGGQQGSAGAEVTVGEELVVFAAASLTDALAAIADSFEVAHPGTRVTLNTAASSLLARQIEEGAPADVFFSASVRWMDYLAAKGLLQEPYAEPLGNSLVVLGDSTLRSPEDLRGITRLAIADPEHVPAGQYAREALECAGLWEVVSPRVASALDVRAVLVAAVSGAADAAIVYASDALVDPSLAVAFDWPAACQPQITYGIAAVATTERFAAAQAFIAYATAPERASTWARFGFVPLPNATQL